MSGKILWLDLETISLDPKDPILEIGARVTDGALETLGQFNIVVHRDILQYHGVEEVFYCDNRRVDPFVVAMHEKSGLWEEVTRSPFSYDFCVQRLAEFVREHFPEGKAILAGSSIHFDRGYVKLQMPEVESQLTYRMLDVSSWTEFLKISCGFETPKVESAHRSISDIEASIRKLKECVQFLEDRGREQERFGI